MFKIVAFFMITLFARLYVNIGILLVRRKHLLDRIISPRMEAWPIQLIQPRHFLFKCLYQPR